MTTTKSAYTEQANHAYFTPAWATRVICRHLAGTEAGNCSGDLILEPACGDGAMAYEIKNAFSKATVLATDIAPDPKLASWLPSVFRYVMDPVDFLEAEPWAVPCRIHIITNPPYGGTGGHAAKFIRKALALTEASRGTVSMLLPMKFDSGSSRTDIFRDHPAFDAKIVLLDRLRWTNLPQKAAGPTGDHAWFFWDWSRGDGYAPAILYARRADHEQP